MSDGAWVFIVNPYSAAGATRRVFERVRGRYQAALENLDVRLTERPGHATELAREAVRGGAEVVVSVGGDGTNNEVVNGFFDEDGERIDSATAFGVVTSGTGGDFRRTFGWDKEPLRDLARLERNERRRVDVGRVRFTAPDGSTKTRCFLNIASFGMSGDVVRRVNQGGKALGGKASFLLATVRALVGYEPAVLRIEADDQPARERKLALVAVANARFFGGGMKIAPEAEVDDGRFDAILVEDGGASMWARHGLKVYRGEHAGVDAVETVRCERMRAAPTGSDTVPLELDGEEVGTLPAVLEVVPATLDLLV